MTTPVSCNLLSGAGARLFIQPADCAYAPWSGTSLTLTLSDLTGVDSDSDEFVGNFTGTPDLKVGFVNQTVYVASGNGFSSTIKGAADGSGSFNIVMDQDKPLADGSSAATVGRVRTGDLYDFCITFGFSDPVADVGAGGQVYGRFRAGQPSLPVQLSGEAIMITIPFNTHGQVFGDALGLVNS